MTDFRPNYRVHPGEVLAEWMGKQGLDDLEFAKTSGFSLDQVTDLLKGKSQVDIATAGLLEGRTGIHSSFWLALQSQYNQP